MVAKSDSKKEKEEEYSVQKEKEEESELERVLEESKEINKNTKKDSEKEENPEDSSENNSKGIDEETFRKLQEQEMKLQELSKNQIFQLQQGLIQERKNIENNLSIQEERKRENLEKNIHQEIRRREQTRFQLEEEKSSASRLDYMGDPNEKYESGGTKRYQENLREEYELGPEEKERKERENKEDWRTSVEKEERRYHAKT